MKLIISEKIKKLRKDHDLTQEELAAVLGVSPQSISKWECGDGYPDITLLPAIANYFEITVDELIGNDEISAKEDIQNHYFNVIGSLDHDEHLELSLRYNKKYPRNWRIATTLMHEISHYHRDKLDTYKTFLYDLCERLLKACTDSVLRRNAIRSICMICEEDEINDWLNKDTIFWYEKRNEVFEERYRLTGNTDMYFMYRHANNFLYISRMLFKVKTSRNYRRFPEKAIGWNMDYLHLLDSVSDTSPGQAIPDGWIPEYAICYMRLAAGYFGAQNNKMGYEYMEKALALTEYYHSIPDGTALDLGNPLFFDRTKVIKNETFIQLPTGKTLANLGGVSEFSPLIHEILTVPVGWEWFNPVRQEARYLSILKRAEAAEKKTK